MAKGSKLKYVRLNKNEHGKALYRLDGLQGLHDFLYKFIQPIEDRYTSATGAWNAEKDNVFGAFIVIGRLIHSQDLIALSQFVCILPEEIRNAFSKLLKDYDASKTLTKNTQKKFRWHSVLFEPLSDVQFSVHAALSLYLKEEHATRLKGTYDRTTDALRKDFYLELVEYKNARKDLLHNHGLLSIPESAHWEKDDWKPRAREMDIFQLYDYIQQTIHPRAIASGESTSQLLPPPSPPPSPQPLVPSPPVVPGPGPTEMSRRKSAQIKCPKRKIISDDTLAAFVIMDPMYGPPPATKIKR